MRISSVIYGGFFGCFPSLLLLALILYVLLVNHRSHIPYLSCLHHIGLSWLLSYVPKDILMHMKAIDSSCIFPMILKSSQKYFTVSLLKVASTVSKSVIFFFSPTMMCVPQNFFFWCVCMCLCVYMNDSDWISQKYVKIKAVDPEKPVQGSQCLHLHLVSLSRSVLGRAMLLDLPFLNQMPSEIPSLLKYSSGWALQVAALQPVHNQNWRTVSFSSFQLWRKKPCLKNFQLSPFISWSGHSQGYLGILKSG